MRCHAPPRAQRAKTAYAVPAGGNSIGSCRHAIPPRCTGWRPRSHGGNASRVVRRGLPGAGNSGSRITHCASVTEDEYTVQPCPRAAWGGHDGHGEIGDDGILGSWSGRELGNHRPDEGTDFFGSPRGTRPPIAVLKHSLTRIGASAARNVVGSGEMRCDELCTAAGVGDVGGTGGRGLRRLAVSGCGGDRGAGGVG